MWDRKLAIKIGQFLEELQFMTFTSKVLEPGILKSDAVDGGIIFGKGKLLLFKKASWV